MLSDARIPYQRILAYQTDGPAKDGVGGEGRKYRDGTLDRCHDSIVPPEIACLLLDKVCDRLDIGAILELHGKRVFF
jgi:hypothetical protein